jgi:[ribosomal protein S5]-alanine N-acetyltransferase
MEMMRYHPDLDDISPIAQPTFGPRPSTPAKDDWRAGLPALHTSALTLREVQIGDAQALFEQLTTEEVARFISPPPASVEGFERFIRWSLQERAAGRHVSFAVVPEGSSVPTGMFQIRILDPEQCSGEWGFALGSGYWGTGLFTAGARLAVDFAFGLMGLRRLEARACVVNERGTAALRKLGAVREAVLHQSFERRGERLDQGLWTISRNDWRFLTSVPHAMVH